MPEGDPVLTLQRCLASLALDPDPAPFETDPAAFASAHGLPEGDQAAFLRFRAGMLFYRQAVRANLWEPVERYLPLTRQLLREAGAWEECRDAFLAARCPGSPFYRDRAPGFLGWLVASAWGRGRWPCLPQLAHFELVKEWVEHDPGEATRLELHGSPAPGDRLSLTPPAQVLAYAYRVNEATLEHPDPPPGPCHLLASRSREGGVQWLLLTETAAALLVQGQEVPLAEAMAALGLGAGVAGFLEDLRIRGILQGFTPGKARQEPRQPPG